MQIKTAAFFVLFSVEERPAFIFGRPITFAGYFLILFYT